MIRPTGFEPKQLFPETRYFQIGKWRFVFRDGKYHGWYKFK